MKHIIDLNSWKRKDVFRFFQDFTDSTISVTTEVVCEKTFKYCKDEKKSFFIYCLFSVLKAANDVREMRYRIENNGQTVVEYDKIDVVTPIKVNEQGKFVEVYIPYDNNFSDFYSSAYNIIHSVNESSDPYEGTIQHKDEAGMMNISVTPDLFFTSIKHTLRHPYGNAFPLLNIGKATMRENRLIIPVAVSMSHALIDGHGLSKFFKDMERNLSDIIPPTCL